MSSVPKLVQFVQLLDVHDQGDAAERAQRARRREVLERSIVAPFHLKKMRKFVALLLAIPGPVVEDGEHGIALALADDQFDGFGGALFFGLTAARRVPGQSEAQLKALAQIQQDLMPALGDVGLKYEDEAALAKARRPKLEAWRQTLNAVPDIGPVLVRWAEGFFDAGDAIAALLARRALAGASTPERTAVRGLRSRLLRQINRFREALIDEIEDGDLPADAEALVFAHLDALLGR